MSMGQAYLPGNPPAVMSASPVRPYGPVAARSRNAGREPWAREAPSSMYTSADYRREFDRVEQRLYWLTIVCIVISIVSILTTIGIVIQFG